MISRRSSSTATGSASGPAMIEAVSNERASGLATIRSTSISRNSSAEPAQLLDPALGEIVGERRRRPR